MNLRPSGYEPDELPGCSTPRQNVKRGAEPAPFGGYVATPGANGKSEKRWFSSTCHATAAKSAMKGVAGGGNSSFGDGLAAAARAIIADGRQALTDPELTGPEAVHEVRKALKRWRALLRLLARPLGEQADQLRTEARELMRAVAGARDAQSALDALTDLRKADLPFSATSTETIRARLTEMPDAASATSFTKGLRDRISRYFDYATLSLERWPLKAIDFDTVTDELRRRTAAHGNWCQMGGRLQKPNACTTCAAVRRAPSSDGSHRTALATPWKSVGGRSTASAQPTRLLSGPCRARELRSAASAAGAMALTIDAVDRSAPRRAFENGGATCRPAVCRKTEGIPPPDRGAMVGARS